MAYINGQEVNDTIFIRNVYLNTLSPEIKAALLNLLAHVAFTDENGQTYYNALYNALYPPAGLTSITAVFEQGSAVITEDTSLDDLKQYLTVTAHYSDETTQTVTDYTLSGTLTEGTSVITVSYGDKTTTFNVTVTGEYTFYDYIKADTESTTLAVDTGGIIRLKQYADLNALSMELKFKYLTGFANNNPILATRIGTGATKSYAVYSYNNAISYHFHGVDGGSATRPVASNTDLNTVKFNNTAESPSNIVVNDGTPVSVTWASSEVINSAPQLFFNHGYNGSSGNISGLIAISTVKFYDLSNNLVGNYRVAVRNADNAIGLYDSVDDIFYTAPTVAQATLENENCKYAVGNWE